MRRERRWVLELGAEVKELRYDNHEYDIAKRIVYDDQGPREISSNLLFSSDPGIGMAWL